MIQRKICLLGSFAVGKTSLASRFVDGPFSGKYLTTIGVKVDRASVVVGASTVSLMIWDMAGEDRFQRVEPAYLRGAAGYLLVVDGTRRATLDQALLLQERAEGLLGRVPFRLLLNKVDLRSEWGLEGGTVETLAAHGWKVSSTSAKTGEGVGEVLRSLAEEMVGGVKR